MKMLNSPQTLGNKNRHSS